MVDIDTLRSRQTNGMNYDVSTEDIISKLQTWDKAYGIQTEDISDSAVTVRFKTVPENTRALAEEIKQFCPDVVSQNFGCLEEMISMAEEMGEAIDPSVLELCEGIDFDDEDYGVEILARSITRDKVVALWWD